MSYDLFVVDIPSDITSVDEMPEDHQSQPIGSPQAVREAILSVAPFADVADQTWIQITGPEIDIEVNLDDEECLDGFAFHIRGGNCSLGVVSEILDRLHLRALDPASPTGIFDPATATESLDRWRAYRDHVVKAK